MADLVDLQERKRPGRPLDPEKRAAILAAGRKLFLKRGFDATSVDAIAAEAGVSKLTVYKHFKDKDRLFQIIIAETCDAHNSPDSFAIAEGRAVRDSLAMIAAGMLSLMTSKEALELHRVLMSEGQRIPRLNQLFYEAAPERATARFAAYLVEEVAAGRLEIDDSQKAAEHFLCMAKGAIWLRAVLGVGPLPTKAEIAAHAESCADLFLRAYAPRAQKKPKRA
jgi:TetR/AcrR family transcriptional repressor of mexJK operon